MNSMYKPNISGTEQWVSTVAGAALALAAYQRKNSFLGLAGLGLIGRGVSGFCPINKAVGRNAASRDTGHALGGSREISTGATYHSPGDIRQHENRAISYVITEEYSER
jgi:uncharacterized membrane protein